VATKSKDDLFLERLGKRLRTLRKQRGWTLEETEARGWPSWRHLQRIESGKNITVLTLIAVCKLYGIKASKLLEDIE
jgi:transcriptional regulator with XRE-family HTH domain